MSIHLKSMPAGRMLRQSSAVNAPSTIQAVEATACPEFIEGPSQKARISVDWKNKLMKSVLAMVLLACIQMNAARVSEADTTFEFYNKDNETVRISEFKVYGGSIKNIDFGPNTMIAPSRSGSISASRAQIKVDDANAFLIFMEIKHPRGTYKYTIRPGHKTAFVSYTSDKSPAVYPQTGPLKGLLGKTESGLPLKNNLKAADIVQGDTRTTREKISGVFGTGY